jgi:ribosomal protein L16 Arg81 hydroxylase
MNAHMDREERMTDKAPENPSGLKVSQPHDPAEKEADRMADKVMKMTDRKEQASNFYKEDITETKEQREPVRAKREEVFRKETIDATAATTIDNLSGGRSLTSEERSFYEPRFGADFSNVNIHTDDISAKTAEAINARAYTKGDDIVFAKGEY